MRNTFRYSFATVLTAGLVVAPLTAAFADTSTDGSGGVGSGNQVVVPADVEADLCGNSLAVLGISQAKCTEVSEVLYESSGQGGPSTDGSGGVASGNQIIVPVDAALDACGNAVGVGGVSEAECVEVVEVLEEESESGDAATTSGSGGVASGNQIIVPVDVAVDVCGNSVAILGSASSTCTTIINIIQSSPENEGDGPSTDGSGGVASGNQVIVPVDAAVDICGNAVSVLGLAEASCLETISDGGDGDEDDGGDGGDDDKDQDRDEDEDTDDGDNGGGDGGDDTDTDTGEEDGGKDGDDSGTADERPAPEPQADEELAVTGSALGGLVAAGVAAIGAGAAGVYFARKRRAAAAEGVPAGDDE
ncbi:chaplin family protein [Nocardiopsis sp. NRRL B-16309]|uniref:chaplin family protein n=1 Tax=Nocardiopsis sp. NRRL B-16309 TaxID=1519494 RepID=UPI0006B01F3E|nr:chaplin family protein [Nocardiopsis sp. NRRL B-16309]KOX11320.1 peptidase [Nocardiopsis sp. NRRL B-16309]